MADPVQIPVDIHHFADDLDRAGAQVDVEELADILWLAEQIGPAPPSLPVATQESQSQQVRQGQRDPNLSPPSPPPSSPTEQEPKATVVIPPSPPSPQPDSSSSSMDWGFGVPIQIPAAAALRSQLDLSRALRPLMRKIPSPIRQFLDEEATAVQRAEQDILSPVLIPAPERRFDLAFVVEDGPSLEIWRNTIVELQDLVQQLGIFRQIRTWGLKIGANQKGPTLELRVNWQHQKGQLPFAPEVLLDPTQRRLIWLVSDCTSDLWDQLLLYKWVQKWGQGVVILQLFPERLWSSTALNRGERVWIGADATGGPLSRLKATPVYPDWEVKPDPKRVKNQVAVPVISLEPEPFRCWAKVMTGIGGVTVAGRMFDWSCWDQWEEEIEEEAVALTPQQQVHLFSTTASLTARKLAGLMAAAPVNLSVVNLIQQTLLPQSQQVHVAEVFMSGLIRALPQSRDSDPMRYDFVDGVREPLRDTIPNDKIVHVLDTLSTYIAEHLGYRIKSFSALVRLSRRLKSDQQRHIQPFAEIGIGSLRRLGGHYRTMAEELAQISLLSPADQQLQKWPPIQEFTFRQVTLEIESFRKFEFETATLELIRRGWRRRLDWQITKRSSWAWQQDWKLSEGVFLEMVQIPGGVFLMGSPENEADRLSYEGPQHSVTVSEFLMSKYPVTQAQWRIVAGWDRVNQYLDPDPARFKGDDRPVERISWYEAVEFCQRLARRTGRDYRLPSEAEWEYACRARTTTPFHFGETITTDLANYNGNYTYGSGPKGICRLETIPVGSLGTANAFGLYDMHGNVWEWCADPLHENYANAPKNARIWEEGGDKGSRLLRGGSWIAYPRNCRSAYRNHIVPDDRYSSIGFRVCCGSPI